MKIVNRKTFLKLSFGTIFSKYERTCFGSLSIKYDTILPNDFFSLSIEDAVDCDDTPEFVGILDSALEKGTSFDMEFETCSRDASFEDDQLFAVWEDKDIKNLIVTLLDSMRKDDPSDHDERYYPEVKKAKHHCKIFFKNPPVDACKAEVYHECIDGLLSIHFVGTDTYEECYDAWRIVDVNYCPFCGFHFGDNLN